MFVPGECWLGIEETVDKLFARLEHVLNYDGNSKARLIAWISKEEYGLDELPTLIRFPGDKYLVMFEPGESTMCACVWPVAAGILTVERV